MNTTMTMTQNDNISINGNQMWSISATNKAGSIRVYAHHTLPVVRISVRTSPDEEFPQWNRERRVEGKTPSEVRAIIDGLIKEALNDGITEVLDEADGPSYGLFMRLDHERNIAKSRVQTWNIWRALDAGKKQLFNELP